MLGNQTEEDTVLPMKTCTGRRAAGEVPSSEAAWGHASRVCLVPVTVQIASQLPVDSVLPPDLKLREGTVHSVYVRAPWPVPGSGSAGTRRANE